MRLAYLSNIRFPSKRAHAVQIVHMCQALSSEGVEVKLFVNKRLKTTKEEINEWFDLETKFSVVQQPPEFFYPNFKWTFYLSEVLFTLYFLFINKSSEYDVTYIRSEWIAYVISIFVNSKKILWESHEAKYNFPARKILQKGVKCICISEGIKEFYIEQGVPSEHMLVAHDAVDSSFFDKAAPKYLVREELGLANDKKIAMYIGNLDKWKGVETFFKASDYAPNVSFVVIGGKEEEISIYKQKYPRVHFLGQRPYKKLVDNQQAADVLVVPNTAQNSLSKSFTSPLKLFAHMASGVPLVVSDIESLVRVTGRDFVSLAKPDSPENLAKTLEKVLLEIDLFKLKALELKRMSTKYTWENRAKSIIRFFKETEKGN